MRRELRYMSYTKVMAGPLAELIRSEMVGLTSDFDYSWSFTYTSFNDCATLRLGLCRNVVNPGGLGPNRVRWP